MAITPPTKARSARRIPPRFTIVARERKRVSIAMRRRWSSGSRPIREPNGNRLVRLGTGGRVSIFWNQLLRRVPLVYGRSACS
jgi:hypothetical protein